MRFMFLSIVMSVVMFHPALAQKVDNDSVLKELDKIEITNEGMKQLIDNYKKDVLKGDNEAMTLLGIQCVTGQFVKPDIKLGLNLIETAAKNDYVEAQYQLGSYLYSFWLKKPDNDSYFSLSSRWLTKSIKNGDNRSTILLARLYNSYGKYHNDEAYIAGSISLLESYPGVSEVCQKDEQVMVAQACLGTYCLGKWRMNNDTTALKDAKKWYRILLKSPSYFPTFSPYIDSLSTVLSMGTNQRIDPMPTDEEIEKFKTSQDNSRFGRGPAMMGGPGGRPQQTAPAPQGPKAYFPGTDMNQYIRTNTIIPESLNKQKMTGNVVVTFTVDTDGSIINPKLTKEADVHFMNMEALRVVMTMPDWIPAKGEDGKAIQYQQNVSVMFGSGGFRY